MVVLGGGTVSYERGNPVGFRTPCLLQGVGLAREVCFLRERERERGREKERERERESERERERERARARERERESGGCILTGGSCGGEAACKSKDGAKRTHIGVHLLMG